MSSDSPNNYGEVVIVGAGPAGLAVAGCLRQNGVPFVMLEQAATVGIKWHQHYDRLHLHTTKRFSALPHFPFPADYPMWVSRQQFIDYLTAYAQHFQIEPRFNQQVESVRRVGDQGGDHWETRTADAVYRSHCVVMATGTNHTPNRPTWPGQDRYQGVVLHSADYKNGEQFRGKPALVIGFGNSGTEIAIDLWEHGSLPSMAVRSPVNITLRETVGIPTQYIAVLLQRLPASVLDRMNGPLLWLKFGDLRRYGLRKLPYGAVTQVQRHAKIPVIDIGLLGLIWGRHVTIRPGVESFIEDGVVFSDGTAGRFDGVILATGYQTALDGILPPEYSLLDDKGSRLNSGQLTSGPGLYFCGFRLSHIGVLYEIGREAQRIVKSIMEETK